MRHCFRLVCSSDALAVPASGPHNLLTSPALVAMPNGRQRPGAMPIVEDSISYFDGDPYPMLLTFDAPDSTIACARRERSNSPLQALTLLNDPVFFECAQALGLRLMATEPPLRKLEYNGASVTGLGRDPTPEEQERVRRVYHEVNKTLKSDPKAAERFWERPK